MTLKAILCKLVLIVFVMYIIDLLLNTISYTLFYTPDFYSQQSNIQRFIINIFFIVAFLKIAHFTFKEKPGGLLNFTSQDSYCQVWTALLIGVCCLLTCCLIYFFQGKYEIDEANIVTFISSVVLQLSVAFKEELLFRGLIVKRLQLLNRNKLLIIGVSACLFLLPHIGTSKDWALLNVFMSGIFWAYIVIEEKNIILPLSFHFFSNVLTSYEFYVLKDPQIIISNYAFLIISIVAYSFYRIVKARTTKEIIG